MAMSGCFGHNHDVDEIRVVWPKLQWDVTISQCLVEAYVGSSSSGSSATSRDLDDLAQWC
ncbi:sNF2 family helicase [Sesbania bispinosa]|nr:sNF2 family helicase [Sesbania bispinosa]